MAPNGWPGKTAKNGQKQAIWWIHQFNCVFQDKRCAIFVLTTLQEMTNSLNIRWPLSTQRIRVELK